MLKPARIYFTIGRLRSGGTTTIDRVLIATGKAATDVAEFPGNGWQMYLKHF